MLAVVVGILPASAQLTWQLAGGNESWPAAKRTAIINAMNQAVAIFNANGYFMMNLTANYNASVPTAQASYGGWIDFGGSISICSIPESGTRVHLLMPLGNALAGAGA